MLTSLVPTATSFNTELSNFRTNFDISAPSSIRFVAHPLPSAAQSPFFCPDKPFPPSCKRPYPFRRITNYYCCDVVSTSRQIRQVDQPIRRLLCTSSFRERGGNLRIRKFVRKPIGAEQQSVAFHQIFLVHVNLHFGFDSKGAQKHVLHIAVVGFVLRHHPAANLFGDE